MISAELALTKTFFDVLVARDAFESPSAVSDVAEILVDVDGEEAEVVPAALSAALGAVSSDVGRWRAAAEVAVQLDLHEVLPTLLSGLSRYRDPHQLANAVTLAANPGVDPDLRSQVLSAADGFSTRGGDLSRLLEVRLGRVRPTSPAEVVLDTQMWPGKHAAKELQRFSPIVYVDSDGSNPAEYWHVLGALAGAGARVRRVGPDVKSLTIAAWASEAFPLVRWTGKAVGRWRDLTGFENIKSVQVAGVSDTLGLPRLLSAVAHQLPPGLVLHTSRDSDSALAAPVFSLETLHDGAFDHLEMMYLGAAKKSVLRTLSRDVLPPRNLDQDRWTFEQLVTLRLLQSFKARVGAFRAEPKQLLSQLRDITAASQTSRVALDANGTVYVDDGSGFRTLKGNQDVIPEVLEVDDAFRPFDLGGGKVPDLFHPARRTAVDPRVLAGTPTVRDRRISARAISRVHATRGMDVLRSAFPELDGSEVGDALKVGNAILSAREVS